MYDHAFQSEENMNAQSLFEWHNSIFRAGLNKFPLSFPALLLIFLCPEKH